uniref:Uncharacterized protein n=1 Tax=Oryza barthii TaxID=65489 RepID=A0A0D3GQ90_9ORYZ
MTTSTAARKAFADLLAKLATVDVSSSSKPPLPATDITPPELATLFAIARNFAGRARASPATHLYLPASTSHMVCTNSDAINIGVPPAGPTASAGARGATAGFLNTLNAAFLGMSRAPHAAPVTSPAYLPPNLDDEATASLHAQAVTVLNIKALIPVTLDIHASNYSSKVVKFAKGGSKCVVFASESART